MKQPLLSDLLADLEQLAKQIDERKSELVTGSTTDFIRRFAAVSKALRSITNAQRAMEDKAKHLLNNHDKTVAKLRREQFKVLKS
ncbi:MAG: hypothetical protein JWN30_1615 [Bacilli bacterium]|nr:hypothetical protein [Bacilli bacterium]